MKNILQLKIEKRQHDGEINNKGKEMIINKHRRKKGGKEKRRKNHERKKCLVVCVFFRDRNWFYQIVEVVSCGVLSPRCSPLLLESTVIVICSLVFVIFLGPRSISSSSTSCPMKLRLGEMIGRFAFTIL